MPTVRRTTVLLRDRDGSNDLDTTGWSDQLAAQADESVELVLVRVGIEASVAQVDTHAVVTCASSDWWRQVPELLGMTADDLVIVAEAATTPAPRLVTQLVKTYEGRTGAVVDARVIPLEITQEGTPGAAKRFEDHEDIEDDRSDDADADVEEQTDADRAVEDPEEDGDDDSGDQYDEAELLPTEHEVSAACTLLDVRTLAQVGEVWAGASGIEASRAAGPRLVESCEALGLDLLVEPHAAIFRSVRVAEDGSPVLGNRKRDPGLDEQVVCPADHPIALQATMLSRLLDVVGMRESATPAPTESSPRPFLSIITRTQGERAQALQDVLTCLAGQTDRDFELLIMCHRAPADKVAGIRDLVTEVPAWLRQRVQVVEVERPGRAAPLNDGFELAGGRYIVTLDDDDVVLEHWVETFHQLEGRAEGQMLRAAALLHRVVDDSRFDDLVPMSCGNAIRNWPLTFRLVDHLRANYTPCMTVAFPRGAFHHLGLRFDETLDTTEDWDLIVRTAGVVGVASAREVTSVYRWWEARGSSRAAHSKAEWDSTMQRVLRGFMQTPLLLSPDDLPRFSHLLDRAAMDAKEAHDLARTYATSQHEVILTLQEVKKAHDRAIKSRDMWQKRAGNAKAKVDKVRSRLNDRHDKHLALLREADRLLDDRPHLRPEKSIFDLERNEVRDLVQQLRDEPAKRSLGERLRPRR